MDQQATLRVTVVKLKLLESITKYSRAVVHISFGKLSKGIPNPRFIKNKEANFYRVRLELTNKTSQKAFIKVCGMGSTGNEMEQIASEHIYVLSIKDNTSFVLCNNKIRLQYEAVMLKDYKEEEPVDDQSKTEINLETQKLSRGTFFEPANFKRSATQNLHHLRDKAFDLQNISVQDKSHLTEKQFKQAHDTRTMYKEETTHSHQIEDELWNNRSEFNFLQPITHTPPRSPKSSSNKLFKLNKRFTEAETQPTQFLQSPKTKKQRASTNYFKNQSNQESNIILYLIISIAAFVIGIISKQAS